MIVGGAFGFVYAGCAGVFLDEFGLGVHAASISIGANIGGVIGAGMGLGGVAFFIGIAANRSAHNRSRLFAAIYGGATSVTLLILYSAVLFMIFQTRAFSTEDFVLLGVVIISSLIVLFKAIYGVSSTVYCEKCDSYLNKSYNKRFSISLDAIRAAARNGDIDALKSLGDTSKNEAKSIVRLDLCPALCCGKLDLAEAVMIKVNQQETLTDALPIVGSIKAAKREDKYRKEFRTVVSGMVGKEVALFWAKILQSPASAHT